MTVGLPWSTLPRCAPIPFIRTSDPAHATAGRSSHHRKILPGRTLDRGIGRKKVNCWFENNSFFPPRIISSCEKNLTISGALSVGPAWSRRCRRDRLPCHHGRKNVERRKKSETSIGAALPVGPNRTQASVAQVSPRRVEMLSTVTRNDKPTFSRSWICRTSHWCRWERKCGSEKPVRAQQGIVWSPQGVAAAGTSKRSRPVEPLFCLVEQQKRLHRSSL